jgi:holliday junction DNA helicase RuvA
MIGKLTGKIDSFGEGHLLLDAGGVGYLVFASSRTLGSIGRAGDPVSLLINTQVREDAITLFGFASAEEQYWFKTLTSVQGVGAKVGLSILSACAPSDLAFIIAAQDKAALTRADGVGPKLAARILTELKDKAGPAAIAAPVSGKAASADAAAVQMRSIDQDAVSALTNLGYASAEAYRAVASVKAQANDNLQEMIRLALKELSA